MAHELDDSSIPEGDDEDMENIEDDLEKGASVDLFWKAVVKPDEPYVASRMEDYFLRITNACLGPDAQKNTRTCLTLAQAADEESEAPGVVCTLKPDHENHQLNLLVTDDVQLSVAGDNPSPVYLVGYLTPAEQHLGDDLDLGDELEEAEDESINEELDELRGKSKQKLGGRKRKLAEMKNDNEGDEETAQKKQKTIAGKAKPQPQQQQKGKNEKEDNKNQNQNQNKNQKNQKNQNQNKNQNQKNKNTEEAAKTEGTATTAGEETPKTTETATAGAAKTSGAAAKDAWKNGPQGIKYKEIRAGEGKAIKKGSKVRVFYVAQVDDKVVDKVITGQGKELKVGDNEVIEGLDKALLGMKVGTKRKITIPAKLAYGEKGDTTKKVPPNTDLTYTVEVKEVN